MHAVVVNVTVKDPEAAAHTMSDHARSVVPAAMTLDGVEVHEVAAHA